MSAEEQDSLDRLKIWQRAVIAAVWLIGPVMMGILVATISGEHGSVLYVVVGLCVGVSGAISYLLLPLLSPFRRLKGIGRIAVCAGVAVLPTVVFSAYVARSGSSRFFYFTSGVAIAFLCICAVLVSLLESRFKSDYF
jgi:hypothetical protein